MIQKIIIVLTALAAFWFNMAQANSQQLSSNPWLEANDDETVQEIYKKEQRRSGGYSVNYRPEEASTIDRTHAYIQTQSDDSDGDGFLDSVSNLFDDNDDQQNQPLIPNTKANRQALARQQQLAQQQTASEPTSTFDFGGQINRLKNSLNLPKLPSMTSMIQKFEQASGINFKSMGQYLK